MRDFPRCTIYCEIKNNYNNKSEESMYNSSKFYKPTLVLNEKLKIYKMRHTYIK